MGNAKRACSPPRPADHDENEATGDLREAVPCLMCHRNMRIVRWLAIASILLLAVNLIIAGVAGSGSAG